MITIYIGLGLNQLRLHHGENGLALGQGQPNGLGGNHICRPVAGDHFASLNAPGCFRQLQQYPPLHASSPVNLDQNSIAPPTLRRSLLLYPIPTILIRFVYPRRRLGFSGDRARTTVNGLALAAS